MVRRLSILFLLLLSAAVLSAQEGDLERLFQDESLDSLIDKALQLHITARILPANEQPVWNSQSRKVTLPGRSVAVRLVGENIRIDVVFTPYQEEDGSLLLVAQGQVWYSEVSEVSKVKTRYLTSIQSLPVSLGEKVLFFPLGVSNDAAATKTLNIQLEVEIFPYRELLDNPAD